MPKPKGLPKTGGRKAGAPNKKPRRLAQVCNSGVSPMEFLLGVMRNEMAEFKDRLEAAKTVANYVHPKLSSIEMGNKDGKPFQIVATTSDVGLL